MSSTCEEERNARRDDRKGRNSKKKNENKRALLCCAVLCFSFLLSPHPVRHPRLDQHLRYLGALFVHGHIAGQRQHDDLDRRDDGPERKDRAALIVIADVKRVLVQAVDDAPDAKRGLDDLRGGQCKAKPGLTTPSEEPKTKTKTCPLLTDGMMFLPARLTRRLSI